MQEEAYIGKKIDYSDDKCLYDIKANPLIGFQNHFNNSWSFTNDELGMSLWSQLMDIINDPNMPDSPFNFW